MVTRALPTWARRGALAVAAMGVAGCYDVKAVDLGVEVAPDEQGLVDPSKNQLGLSGHWYSYGDQYDAPRACIDIGMHPPAECSLVSWPMALPSLDFPNEGGSMCTLGSVARIANCVESPEPKLPCPAKTPDYSNIWGSGIGLDFKLWPDDAVLSGVLDREPLARRTWDPTADGIVGVAFDFLLIDGGVLGEPHVRVEFPILMPLDLKLPPDKGTASLSRDDPRIVQPAPAGEEEFFPDNPAPSEEHPSGSPFWGAPVDWGMSDVSPVRRGHNEVRFSEVRKPPESNYEFDVTQLLGVQFHVPPLETSRLDYGFCISNLTFLRE